MFFNKVYLEEPYFCRVWDRSAENCFEDPDHILSSDGVEHVFLRPFCGVNMQEWFEILWEGVEAAKNHHRPLLQRLFQKKNGKVRACTVVNIHSLSL